LTQTPDGFTLKNVFVIVLQVKNYDVATVVRFVSSVGWILLTLRIFPLRNCMLTEAECHVCWTNVAQTIKKRECKVNNKREGKWSCNKKLQCRLDCLPRKNSALLTNKADRLWKCRNQLVACKSDPWQRKMRMTEMGEILLWKGKGRFFTVSPTSDCFICHANYGWWAMLDAEAWVLWFFTGPYGI